MPATTFKNILTKTYSGINREIWLLAITMLINRSGSMVLLFMSVYLTQHMGFTISQAGIVMSMFGFGSLIGAFIGGKLVDRFGYYYVLIFSLVLSGVILIFLGQMVTFEWIAGFTFLVTATGDMYRPANGAAITVYSSPTNYTQSIGLNRLAMNLGFTVGPIVGGLLAMYNYELLFWADGVTCISAAVFISLYLPKKQNKPKKDVVDMGLDIKSPYKDLNYILFLIFTGLYALSFFQLITTVPLFYKEICQYTEQQIGWILAINGLGIAVIEMFLLFYIKDKWTNYKFIALGIMLLVPGYILLTAWHNNTAIVLNIVLFTVSEMLAMPFMLSLSMKRANSKTMGSYMALYSIAWSLALILAPIAGTFIIDHLGYNSLWLAMAGIAVISFTGMRLLERYELENEAATG